MEKEYIKINRNAYDELAEQYLNRNIIDDYEIKEDYWHEMFKDIISRDNMDVLEIGPGSGRNLKIFDDLNCNTTGIELSPKMSKVAKIWSPNSKIITGNILECELEPKSYDLIFVMAVIHNFPLEDQKLLLDKIINWLKDDGYLVLGTTINEKESDGLLTKKDYAGEVKRYRYSHTKDSFEELVINNKFKIVKSYIVKEEKRYKTWYDLVCMKNKGD